MVLASHDTARSCSGYAQDWSSGGEAATDVVDKMVLASAHPTRAEWSYLPMASVSQSAADQRDAQLRLLVTDLAIRLFRHDEGRLPESLEELTPRYLSAVPLDPFSGNPLLYRCREVGYILYSVWRDGSDDGGRFGTVTEIWVENGFDLDLNVYRREAAQAAGATKGNSPSSGLE